MKRLLTLLLVVALTAISSGTALAAKGEGADLAAIRRATVKYHDVQAAMDDGYVPASPCMEMPGVGAMGIHYLNPEYASDLTIDPMHPEVLLYIPRPDGSLKLVGVEYFAVALVATPDGPAPWMPQSPPPYDFFNPAPSVLGHTFDGPMAGHDPTMPWHYDKHVWIWQHNPAGTWEQWNSSLTCPAA